MTAALAVEGMRFSENGLDVRAEARTLQAEAALT